MARKRKTVDFVKSETTPLRRFIAFLCYAGVGIPFALPFALNGEEFIKHHLYRAVQMLLLFVATFLVFVNSAYIFESVDKVIEAGDAAFSLLGLPTIIGLSFFILVWTALVIYFSWFSFTLPITGKAWNTEPGLVTVKWSLIIGGVGGGFGLLIGVMATLFG
jgi:hypothetical protein